MWEYKVSKVWLQVDEEDKMEERVKLSEQVLNNDGKEGWELAAVVCVGKNWLWEYLKRPVPES